jgi:hypothetical protein
VIENGDERDGPAGYILTKPVWDWGSPRQMTDERVKLVQDAGVDSDMKWPTPLQVLKG